MGISKTPQLDKAHCKRYGDDDPTDSRAGWMQFTKDGRLSEPAKAKKE
jgi:hypothetical protein